MRDMRGGPLGVFGAAILLHYFASYSSWSLRITFCFVLANLCGFLLPLLPSCCHVWVRRQVFFPLSILSVWRCQLAAAGRGGSRFQGCLVTSFAVFFTVGLPANLLGTSSQAHQLAMSLKGQLIREVKHNVYVKRQTRICTTWTRFPFACRLLFIISTHKLVVSRNVLSIRIFWAVFICSFSILRNSQPESDVCRLRYTWNLNSLLALEYSPLFSLFASSDV